MISLNSRVVRRLLDFFFIHEDDSFYLNEIVRRIDVDKRNLSKQIKELEISGLFNVEKKGNLKLYSLNKNYPLYNEYKK
ncbi:hypothetical protein KKA47_00740, partial [bacterium]|nr:hypothetical protein [bacterium]